MGMYLRQGGASHYSPPKFLNNSHVLTVKDRKLKCWHIVPPISTKYIYN